MQARLLLSATLFALLTGCEAQSQPLPESEKLSTDKVKAIAERVETNYPDLSRDLRERILATVVRSLDDMVFIEGGEFEMGDFGTLCQYDPANMGTWPYGQDPERLCPITPERHDDYLHQVRLSSYHLSRYQTRLEDFDLFRTSLGLELFDAELRKREDLQELFHPAKPAWTKNWKEAKDYCLWLGELSRYPVDLPSEAQWEYAARNRGQYVQYPTDNGSLGYGRNIAADEVTDELPIAHFTPTPLGLYDMAGNATDWVSDWYSENYYRVSPVENPKGPATGTQRVRRGSNYQESMWMSANTVRRWNDEPEKSRHLPGTSFRCSIQSDAPL
ncbi:formylglycine-generating enzyme family protein [Halopseudomonas sabulinigri]|uniref:Formylglycine-generating enzyme, required for sulfatase activity, contains SUMF1/FGE domain n=1 Tax=Halopseudomonas sabulinigri TaxID=472181 RepID=A0A1H1VEI4_9GAMM|nr:SUMF1/EgtB/PvdO family nonheme iron enzyme [Halopseudomonas sabulinigri]SDS82831.1 Formylglycine-generating enzyme, required for sulfatase activity, contains SUMF1/FGE domain [Halopseudomonas sabulinigri]